MLHVLSLCALSADELLLADDAGGLRAVSLCTKQLVGHEPAAIRDNVRKVALNTHTDTLLLLVRLPLAVNAGDPENSQQLVALRCAATQTNGLKCTASTPVSIPKQST